MNSFDFSKLFTFKLARAIIVLPCHHFPQWLWFSRWLDNCCAKRTWFSRDEYNVMQFYAETLRRKGEARLQGYGNGVGSLAPRLSDTLVARLYRCSEFELRIYTQVMVLSVATRLSFFCALAFHLLLWLHSSSLSSRNTFFLSLVFVVYCHYFVTHRKCELKK